MQILPNGFRSMEMERKRETESTVFANSSHLHVTCYWNHKAIWHIVDFIEFIDWDQENANSFLTIYLICELRILNFQFWCYYRFNVLLTFQYKLNCWGKGISAAHWMIPNFLFSQQGNKADIITMHKLSKCKDFEITLKNRFKIANDFFNHLFLHLSACIFYYA